MDPLVPIILFSVAAAVLPIVATWRVPPFSTRAYWLTVLVVLAIEIVWMSVSPIAFWPGEPISPWALIWMAIPAALGAILLIGVLVWSAAGLLKVDSISPATSSAGVVTIAVAALVAILASSNVMVMAIAMLEFLGFGTEVSNPNTGSVPFFAIAVIVALSWAGLFILGRRAKPGYLRFVGIVQLVLCGVLVLLILSFLLGGYLMTAAHGG